MDSYYSPLIILGSGPAGYTAALYATRAGIRPLLITGPLPGGQLMTTTAVENWPGDPLGLTGPGLMHRMEAQLAALEITPTLDTIHHVKAAQTPFELDGEENAYRCHALIIATGASARYLGLPSEAEYRGRGVSACATCDGFFYQGQAVAVVGGGNTALEEALYLSQLASRVYLVHRRTTFRAEQVLIDRLHKAVNDDKIVLCLNAAVSEILGNGEHVIGLQLNQLGETTGKTLDVAGVFIAIGHTPNVKFLQGQLACHHGFLAVQSGQREGATRTSIPGIFAAGDVADPHYRQAITAAGTGCMAALDAKTYLAERGII